MASWFRRAPDEIGVTRLYAALVEQARAPVFYRDYGVPDSLDGRYEMLALHAFLVLRRLKHDGGRDHDREATASLGQALFDAMFADMDRSLREIGVGDLSVGPRVKEMARGLYGRIAAYEAAIVAAGADAGADVGADVRADGEALARALARNVYGTVTVPPAPVLAALATYVRAADARLAAQPVAVLVASAPPWPAIPPLDAAAPVPDGSGPGAAQAAG